MPSSPLHSSLGGPQVDGEPWQQAAAVLDIQFKGQALMLRRLDSAPLARMAATVAEVRGSRNVGSRVWETCNLGDATTARFWVQAPGISHVDQH